jgi:hypothetical protein
MTVHSANIKDKQLDSNSNHLELEFDKSADDGQHTEQQCTAPQVSTNKESGCTDKEEIHHLEHSSKAAQVSTPKDLSNKEKMLCSTQIKC